MKRKDAFNKYTSAIYKEGCADGHKTAMISLIFACGIMTVLDIIDANKRRKTTKELCENHLNNHVYIDEDDEE